MTYLVMSLISFVVAISVLFMIFAPKYYKYVIPALFLIGFGVLLKVNDYVGYAVDGSLIPDGTEAVVLYQGESDPWIYYTLLFKGSAEPRLVKMPVTKENKEENKKNKSDTPQVIRFGKKKGSSSGKNGNGQEDDSDFTILPYSESEIGKK